MPSFIPCILKELPASKHMAAAKAAVGINPSNHPPLHLAAAAMGSKPSPAKLTLLIGKRWSPTGAKLGVTFLDNPPADLRARILSHMNSWGLRAAVQFFESTQTGEVRITREPDGYWSYLGTDILLIPGSEPTMNLQGFTSNTPDTEFYRVVRHETGHTLGFPHEHLRRTLVNRIDPKKAIAYFGATQGWSPAEVRAQVLTPLEAVSLLRSYRTDEQSIMCYRIPGSITRTGRPIIGGTDITDADYKFAASVYPIHGWLEDAKALA